MQKTLIASSDAYSLTRVYNPRKDILHLCLTVGAKRLDKCDVILFNKYLEEQFEYLSQQPSQKTIYVDGSDARFITPEALATQVKHATVYSEEYVYFTKVGIVCVPLIQNIIAIFVKIANPKVKIRFFRNKNDCWHWLNQ